MIFNTSLLDEIVASSDAQSIPQNTQSATYTRTASTPQTSHGLDSVNTYRGLAQPLSASSGMPSALDWNTVLQPMYTQHADAPVTRQELSPVEGFKAIRRSDTGACLGVCTNDYKPVQNAEMMEQFLSFAEAGDLKLKAAGVLEGGKRVFASAESAHSKTVEFRSSSNGAIGYAAASQNRSDAGYKKGDVLRLMFLLSNGHAPGTAFKVRAIAERIACLNGATCQAETTAFSMTHRATFGDKHRHAILQLIASAFQAFDSYALKANLMAQTPASKHVNTLFLAELIQPQLIEAAATKLLMSKSATMEEMGSRVLSEILERDRRIIDINEFSRPMNKLVEVLNHQGGSQYSEGTLWHGYNTVTNYVDHQAGRSDESGVRGALFGTGDSLKAKALELAQVYVKRMGVRN